MNSSIKRSVVKLKQITCLTIIATFNLSLLIDEVSAQSLSRKQCRRLAREVTQAIQERAPAPLSSEYNNYWFNTVPSALAQLQAKYPECNIFRSQSSSSESDNRELQRSQQRRLEETRRENQRQIHITNMIILCQQYGKRYDRSSDSCVNY
jgi:hypothetical protein